MTALVRSRDTRGAVPTRGTYPVAANAIIFKGGIVALNSSGDAIAGTTIAGGAVVVAGKASHDVNNTGGAAGAVVVEVEFGAFQYENSGTAAVTAANNGKVVFLQDDQTISGTSQTSTLIAAGIQTEFRDSKPVVWMGTHIWGLLA